MTDPLNGAIAATAKPVLHLVTISSTGRQFGVPPDLTSIESLEIALFLAGAVHAHLKTQQPKSRILVPTGLVVKPS